MSQNPALLIDADGVALPLAALDEFPVDLGYTVGLDGAGEEIVYHPKLGTMINEFADAHGCEPFWCSYRRDLVDIAPLFGVRWHAVWLKNAPGALYDTTWKYDDVLRWADGRPLIWFDDEHGRRTVQQHRFLQARPPGATQLVTVEGAMGMNKTHLDEAAWWLTRG